MSNANTTEFEPVRGRQEVRWRSHVIPARDFDAALFVREVHSARLLMVPPRLERLLSAYGWLLDRALALSVSFVAAMAFVTQRWLRRRRARRASRPRVEAAQAASGAEPRRNGDE